MVEKWLRRMNILVVMKVRADGGEKPPHIEKWVPVVDILARYASYLSVCIFIVKT